ncbi:ornithine decarboxylase antizyme [Colletotrichum abscissum]|uniref:Ornithine decarboxylase antizyme n=3 Tax=Colletotrichum acutatum species complex TaxID=2707335 RepID=A0A9Q8SWS7_9PEZI|nr:ornithine decarboxylase antizyme [Colletotrichum lupini]XP_060315990.1 ornithine decarboxylase antizyme [Colletotrichum costaricense]XP_060398322.1 ornithine decarboxylase antizyme [Colletotrichum abscissum]KAK1469162.1 ornithine decarboxylase antizyme [Colletotrichum melonis]KAK1495946.1 ornithine decarboxylase antizyme [Colletotrichum abscissum]KAK1530943.1 ornithine decarboxylase antizyme [Colletotrichum costaricense]UQC84943.1 ornithine decarboxylase antizyme [Colletotrichum lupini]
MAPMNQVNNYSSSNYGEAIVRQANVLASCYIVDSAATLRGLHYCTTGAAGLPSPPSSPPLAAITASNELALLPKASSSSSKRRDTVPGKRISRRGGAALSIREECERFFCESMRAVFRGETDTGSRGSGLHQGAYYYNNGSSNANNMLPTPPPDEDLAVQPHVPFGGRGGDGAEGFTAPTAPAPATAWLEVWDFAGGASFRAFVADDGAEKSLFALFDRNVIGRDLKPALMALMELVDGPLNCQHLVVCIDRTIEEEDAKSLMKSLQWIGFELTTLDQWARDVDVTSNLWLFMSMEI